MEACYFLNDIILFYIWDNNAERQGDTVTMIFDISESNFRHIFNDKDLFLPIRWDGDDFSETLKKLFGKYLSRLEIFHGKALNNRVGLCVSIDEIKSIIDGLVKSIEDYLKGFPAKAYQDFEYTMSILEKTPLREYEKSAYEQFGYDGYKDDPLRLFRVVKVDDDKTYMRRRVFHTPYNLRSKVSTNRYSIAGYPSLYLGTSLELCCDEIKAKPTSDQLITSVYKLDRSFSNTNIEIRVVELGIKPQDFINNFENNIDTADRNQIGPRRIRSSVLLRTDVRNAYFLWYPLIAASSYIRINKKEPFAVEYIIPQLLMQWIRYKTMQGEHYSELIGIRYFSCASKRSSEKGFNYVFPTSGTPYKPNFQYCDILTKAFRMTKPDYIHEYNSIDDCEAKLRALGDNYYDTPDR